MNGPLAPPPPPVHKIPSGLGAVTIYASLLLSLLAVFAAMRGKQWLDHDLRSGAGKTIIEHCGDRQRKCDEFEKWWFYLYIEAPGVMLYFAIGFLLLGIFMNVMAITDSVALWPVLGSVALFVVVTFVGVPPSRVPEPTPSTATTRIYLYDHLSWSLVLTFLHRLWKDIVLLLPQVLHAVLRLLRVTRWRRSVGLPLPTTQRPPQEPASFRDLWENIQCKVLRAMLRLPQAPAPSTTPDTPETSSWLEHKTMVALRRMNANDDRCVSWVFWNITSQEVLDLAIRLAGTILWFEEGLNVVPPYNLLVSILMACFDFTGDLRPGSRDRAYYFARAVLWIRIRAMCSPEEVGEFPLPTIRCGTLLPDRDLREPLEICGLEDTPRILARMYHIPPDVSPEYLQWSSNALLHLSWAERNTPGAFGMLGDREAEGYKDTISSEAIVNRLLASCIFLGRSVEGVVLRIQDKSCGISYFRTPSHSCFLY